MWYEIKKPPLTCGGLIYIFELYVSCKHTEKTVTKSVGKPICALHDMLHAYNYITKQKTPDTPRSFEQSQKRLALGKLALLAGTFEAELLAFAFARIALQEFCTLQGAAVVAVELSQSLSDT